MIFLLYTGTSASWHFVPKRGGGEGVGVFCSPNILSKFSKAYNALELSKSVMGSGGGAGGDIS